MRTRRYHALLLTATYLAADLKVLVNGVEAQVKTAASVFPLTTQRYAPNLLHPRGFERIVAFADDSSPPRTFRFDVAMRVVYEVLRDLDACETLLRWLREARIEPCQFAVRPLLSELD